LIHLGPKANDPPVRDRSPVESYVEFLD
jgi:hypothetical protein